MQGKPEKLKYGKGVRNSPASISVFQLFTARLPFTATVTGRGFFMMVLPGLDNTDSASSLPTYFAVVCVERMK